MRGSRSDSVGPKGTTFIYVFSLFIIIGFVGGLWNVRGVAAAAHQDPKFVNSRWEEAVQNHTRKWMAEGHTNNWAVLVATSIFWHNYRHVANVFSMYRNVKRMGIPDSHIILMVADDIACNARNPYPGTVFNHRNHNLNLYGTDIEVDYRGYEVSVENFLRLLTGKHHEDTPRSKRLITDEHSNILIYMTGHGGDEFLKFQDFEEICSKDLADAFEQMWEGRRYHEILFVVDTCQAATLYRQFRSPNIVAIGSSAKKENSYSHHSDSDLGLAMIDRFTYHALNFFEQGDAKKQSLFDLFSIFHDYQLGAKAMYRTDLLKRPLDTVTLLDFFGAETHPKPTRDFVLLNHNETLYQQLLVEEKEHQALVLERQKDASRGGTPPPLFHFPTKEKKKVADDTNFVATGVAFVGLAVVSVLLFK